MNVKIVLLLLALLCLQFTVSSQNCSFSLSENHQNTTCPNSETGSISLTISGTLPFSLSWSKQNDPTFQSTAQQLNNLGAGVYTALVTDSLDCQQSLVITISNGIDFTPPSLQCPGNQLFNLPTGACSKIFNFTVSATDNCTNPTILQTDNSGWGSGDAFPIGTHNLSFSASDGFQTSVCNFSITVNEFQLPGSPVMSCASGINVSVGQDCEPNLNADLVLVSSQHGCYDDYILEFRNASGFLITNFSNYIGQTISVKVKDPDSGNNCTASVTLYDNLKPYFLPTDTLNVPCGTTLANLHPSIIGMPTVVENCSNYTTTFSDQLTPIGCQDPIYTNVNAVLRRTWIATDQYNNISNPFVQVIFFTRKTLADVVFPLNRNDIAGQLPSLPCGTTQTQPIFTGSPTIDGISITDGGPYCNFAVNFTDAQIQGCGISYDILRTWTVFDECLNLIKTHVQVIQIRDKVAPVMVCPVNFSVSTNQNNCGASFFLPPLISISDNCSGYSVTTQTTGGPILNNIILNMGMGTHAITYKAVDICGNQAQCQTQVTIFDGNSPSAVCKPSKQVGLSSDGTATLTGLTFDNGSHDDCTSDANLIWSYEMDLFNDGSVNIYGNSGVLSGQFPIGIHRVQYKVEDASGNVATITQFVVVEDCLPPVLQCPDLTMDLDASGFVNLQSSDFQVYANENCSDNEDIDLFLSFYDTTYTDVLPSSQAATFLAFGCPDTLYHLTLFAGDESENWSKCDFHLKIYDALGNCNAGEPSVSISGNILTEEGDVVELVEVNVNSTTPATSANGFYAFYSLPLGGDFSVIPIRDDDHLNGVTTFDLVRIRKHVLNVTLLDSPYKMIAADANKSGTITTLDLVEIQKLIIGNISQFQYNTSWRFVDANFVFPNPANPFATYFPEIISYNNLFDSEIANFIAVKIGDVNNSANSANLLVADNRSEEVMEEMITTPETIMIKEFSPNLVETTSVMNFYLPASETVKLMLVDQQGKLVGYWEKDYENGWQSWEIDAVILPRQGIYFYEMTVGKIRKSGKVVKQ